MAHALQISADKPTESDDSFVEPKNAYGSDNTSEVTKRRQHRQRMALVGITAIVTIFYTGAFFGWGPMQLLLEEDGAFEDACLEDEPLPCPAQTSKLLNVQFFAQFALMISPIFGILVDAYGPFCMMSLSAVFMVSGLGSLALAVAQDIDVLLYPAFLFVGLTTVSSHQNIMQAGMLFHGKMQQRVISVMNSLFDAGALTYLGLWAIQNPTDISLELLVGVYLVAGVCVFGSSLYLWHIVVPAEETKAPSKANEVSTKLLAVEEEVDEAEGTGAAATRRVESSPLESEDPGDHSVPQSKEKEDKSEDRKVNENYVLISERPLLKQLLSKQFILLLAFFAFHSAHNVFMLTTARDFLAYLGDDETGNRYLSIFVLMTPVSILGLPFMDYILNRYGYHMGLQSINILAIAYGLVKVCSDSLQVQVFGFLLFSMFRCFMFTITFSFLPTFMAGKVVGRAAGIMVLSQGITSLVNIPLASWAVNGLDGNFFIPNLLYTVGVVPFLYIAWLMGRGVHQETRASDVDAANVLAPRRVEDHSENGTKLQETSDMR